MRYEIAKGMDAIRYTYYIYIWGSRLDGVGRYMRVAGSNKSSHYDQ
jgi:hypothetical protein